MNTVGYPSYLPTTASLSVIREIITDPLINLAQSHFLLWRAVDSKCDEAGVAIRGLAVLVLLDLLLVQSGVGVQQSVLLGHARSVGILCGVCLLDGRAHGELWQPVHGGEAALQL